VGSLQSKRKMAIGKRCGGASQMDEAILLTKYGDRRLMRLCHSGSVNDASTGAMIGVFGRMSNASYHAIIN